MLLKIGRNISDRHRGFDGVDGRINGIRTRDVFRAVEARIAPLRNESMKGAELSASGRKRTTAAFGNWRPDPELVLSNQRAG